MALTDDNSTGMVMPVQPMGGGYGGYGYPMAAYPVMPYGGGFGGGFDGFGGDWIILFLFAMMFGGGWGGMGGFGGGFGNMFEFPWLLTGQQGINANTNAGFNQAATASAIGDLNNNVVSGFGEENVEKIKPYSFQSANSKDDIINYPTDSEFGRLINGKAVTDVLNVMQELMNTLLITNPELYNFAVRRFNKI